MSGASVLAVLATALLLSACDQPSSATDPNTSSRQEPGASLALTWGGATTRTDASRLLARDDVTTIEVADDVSYHRAARYRAVPMADLLPNATSRGASTLEVKASDGFTAEVPLALLKQSSGASPHAYLAIEDSASPWPALPGKSTSAGPFYLIWAGPRSGSVSAEYWPYQIVSMALKIDPAARWSALSPKRVSAWGAGALNGRRLFVANCLSCHQLDGEGNGKIGPDLNRPMNPTSYFQRQALHQYIRDPASLRHWPEQQMPGFGTDRLSDGKIEEIIDYLSAVRKSPAS